MNNRQQGYTLIELMLSSLLDEAAIAENRLPHSHAIIQL